MKLIVSTFVYLLFFHFVVILSRISYFILVEIYLVCTFAITSYIGN